MQPSVSLQGGTGIKEPGLGESGKGRSGMRSGTAEFAATLKSMDHLLKPSVEARMYVPVKSRVRAANKP